MADNKTRVICVGEVMVELSRGNDGRYGQAFGGDTFNTAVYLARAGIPAAYATAMGDDPYSDALMALATAEGVNGDLIRRVPGRMPGLYLIETDPKGERKFYYWRDTSPARELFELPDWAAVAEALLSARLVYFSGVTLSLYSNTGIGRFLAALELARRQGVKVAFDGNFRPRGWKGDVARARTVFAEALEARRHRAADLRGRGDAVGRYQSGGDGGAAAGVRHRRDRGEERLEHRAGRGPERPRACAGAGSGRADRHHGGGRFVQRRLSGGAAERREPRWRPRPPRTVSPAR